MLKNLSSLMGLILILLTVYHDFTIKKSLKEIKAKLS